MTEDLWGAAKVALERVPVDPPAPETLTRRARTLRTRRYAVAGLALIVLGAGLLFPLRLLSRLSTPPERGRVGPGSSSATPPIPEERQFYHPDWFAHVNSEGRFTIEAPRDWVYRKDAMTSGGQRTFEFALGPWNIPDHWVAEPCGFDGVLRFLPDTGVLVWMERIEERAGLLDDLGDRPLRLPDLMPGVSGCVPAQRVDTLGFRYGELGFVVHVAFGVEAPDSLRATVDQVLATFRTRAEEQPFPPDPIGPVIEVAGGTAFGRTWSLSAYWTEYVGEEVICYRILGSGSGCANPSALLPEADAYVQSVNATTSSGLGMETETFVYGVVWKGVAGVTLTLDDGRVLSSQTLNTKKLPVAFYVIPYEGDAQVETIEALDDEGNVLEQSSLRP